MLVTQVPGGYDFKITKGEIEHLTEVYDRMNDALQRFFYEDERLNADLSASVIRDYVIYQLNYLVKQGLVKYIGNVSADKCPDGSWDVQFYFHDTDPAPVVTFTFIWNSKMRRYLV